MGKHYVQAIGDVNQGDAVNFRSVGRLSMELPGVLWPNGVDIDGLLSSVIETDCCQISHRSSSAVLKERTGHFLYRLL